MIPENLSAKPSTITWHTKVNHIKTSGSLRVDRFKKVPTLSSEECGEALERFTEGTTITSQ